MEETNKRPLRVALYARVSTEFKDIQEEKNPVRRAKMLEKRQETENQLQDLREFCSRNGWVITEEYIDRASGKTGERSDFKRMFEDASRRKFDLVVFWALDRMTREGTLETLAYLKRLDSYGVGWRSYTESYIDSLGPFRDVVISLLATLAKIEREKISERTKAGLRRAKREGKRIGRERITTIDAGKIQEMQRAGASVRLIAAKSGVSLSTIMRMLKKAKGAA